MANLHDAQLALIHRLHEWRSPAVDDFFRSMAFLDTFVFTLLVVSCVWYAVSWRWGLSLAILLIISDTSNYLLKGLFEQPRPATLDPTVALSIFTHYSFPSGGAQQAAVLFGSLASWASAALKGHKGKQWAIWSIACLIIFFISFTRVFLGAHFPTDVMGSWLVAALLIALFNTFSLPIAKWFELLTSKEKVAVAILFSALPFVCVQTFSYALLSMFAIGTLLGFLLARKKSLLWEPKTALHGVLSTFFVVATLVGIVYGLFPWMREIIGSKVARLTIQFVIGLWISCGASICLRVLLRKNL